MSDYRISFIYQDSNEDWWFAVAREGDEASDRKSWFDNLIYAGPCPTREDAENCADLFQNISMVIFASPDMARKKLDREVS